MFLWWDGANWTWVRVFLVVIEMGIHRHVIYTEERCQMSCNYGITQCSKGLSRSTCWSGLVPATVENHWEREDKFASPSSKIMRGPTIQIVSSLNPGLFSHLQNGSNDTFPEMLWGLNITYASCSVFCLLFRKEQVSSFQNILEAPVFPSDGPETEALPSISIITKVKENGLY